MSAAANRRERLGFAGLQAARVAFYGAHYLAARLLARDNVSQLAKPRHRLPSLPVLARAMTALFAQDWKNVEAGLYPAPFDLRREARNAMVSARYLADIPKVVKRQREGGHDDVEGAGDALPRYYRRNFHFQTDGYLSERSAKLYDFQVEALFAGTADAMRRRAYVPVAEYLSRKKIRNPAVLDAAAGTGRFISFVKSVQPQVKAIALDLSEPYLARAKKRAAKMGHEIETIAAPAEKIPLPDKSVDVVTAIYLFHELPPKVRRAVVAEVRRVLRPGGTLIFVDSLQSGDEPDYDAMLDYFPAIFHEPYYASYLREDLDRLWQPGFRAGERHWAYFSKVLSYRRDQGSADV